MSYETVPTVTVMRGKATVRINASDYDPKVDKLVETAPAPEPEVVVEAAPEPEPEAAVADEQPVQLGLVKKGRRYFVVNVATGEPVELDGIDVDGYTTEAAAIEAAQAAMAG